MAYKSKFTGEQIDALLETIATFYPTLDVELAIKLDNNDDLTIKEAIQIFDFFKKSNRGVIPYSKFLKGACDMYYCMHGFTNVSDRTEDNPEGISDYTLVHVYHELGEGNELHATAQDSYKITNQGDYFSVELI